MWQPYILYNLYWSQYVSIWLIYKKGIVQYTSLSSTAADKISSSPFPTSAYTADKHYAQVKYLDLD